MQIFKLISQIEIDPNDLDIPTEVAADDNTVAQLLEITFGVLGAVALLVIIIAGMRFVLSRGEPDKAAKARNTVIYAAVGLVLAMLAFTFVRIIAERAS